jgi:hypothetical protein
MAHRANRDAYEAIALAVRLHGHKRGWHLAGVKLGVTERTARAIANGESSGATIHPDTALAARLELLDAEHAALLARLEHNRLEAQCAQISGVQQRACSPVSVGGASMRRDGAPIKQGA